ncbi:MAG: hypothetical protein LBE83_05080 [Propionibacteriaceae bacterium]|jgi:hypothetical protein|nr:hypothetical protein [Propionibacteriaceae bacterium]
MKARDIIGTGGRRLGGWLLVYAGIVALVGVIAGIIWNRTVQLPSYVIGDDYWARISEGGLAQIVGVDVAMSLIGLIAGPIIGLIAWVLFRQTGWPVTIIASLGAGLAAVIARGFGEFIGPRDFPERIATATKGDLVKIDFAAHTWVPLALWVAMAMVPILIGSLIKPAQWITHEPGTESDSDQVKGASAAVGVELVE